MKTHIDRQMLISKLCYVKIKNIHDVSEIKQKMEVSCGDV